MGARPDQQLALTFLRAIHDLWLLQPGDYPVEQNGSDLIAALAQMSIKALAPDVRDTAPDQQARITGVISHSDLSLPDTDVEPGVPLREVLNKIVHGTPTRVTVSEHSVNLYYANNEGPNERHPWTEMWFSGTELLAELDRILHKRPGHGMMRQQIKGLIDTLGEDRFGPRELGKAAS